MLGKRQTSKTKIQITQKTPLEQQVHIQRGRKVLVDRVVCLNRAELDAFIAGCRLIEDVLERSKRNGNQ